MMKLLRNREGSIPFIAAFILAMMILLMCLMLWTSSQISMISVRNHIKDELANVSIRISEDTYTAMSEGNLEEYYPACNSYVGVHKGTKIPKGTLADGDLRNLRIKAHHAFDSIWKNNILTKREAYHWLQDKFCLRADQAHIGQFSEYMCRQVIEESQKVLENNQNRRRIVA